MSIPRNLSRRTAVSGALCAFTLLLAGCGGGGSSSPSATPTPGSGGVPGNGTGRLIPQPNWNVRTPSYQQNKKKWTFLVFMNGANDLEEFGSLNMNQMEQIGSDDNVNMVVQFKRIKNRYDASDGDWGGSRRYFVTKDADTTKVNSVLLSENGDIDAGKWENFQDFVQWGLQTYPADRYCLVVWNHGAGWRGVKLDKQGKPTRGVSYDDTTDSHIDTIDIPKAIDMGNGRKWDVLAFDSSLMQMAEVAYEVRDKATYITGSEESPPGEGYPYQLFMGDLAANPNMAPVDFAQTIVQRTIESYGPDSNITHSVLDASKVGDLAPAFDALGAALTNAQFTYKDAIIFARQSAENYDYPQNIDALDFLRLLTVPTPGNINPPVNDPAVLSAASTLQEKLNAAIIKNVNGSGHPNSNGLSVFVPSPSAYRRIDIDQANGFGQRYSLLSFAKAAPRWQNFLVNGPE